ncbi:uncharacterized protein BDZ99DRAFT_109907 [Mytilinidion resinicola]|uniref:Uncharacterized protein n=1 Tax=Mytilinidion resinicola TaxID=574789 RepID=A0A6A6YAH4_9PEZI|nr:uncharacterized protein BDZ99DRAFT_109907 [Mytilinidion resinicola]KAF2805700.1 hypothetical protein BDZ99DRAFT_109907 [Mytilinidion resinicola]
MPECSGYWDCLVWETLNAPLPFQPCIVSRSSRANSPVQPRLTETPCVRFTGTSSRLCRPGQILSTVRFLTCRILFDSNTEKRADSHHGRNGCWCDFAGSCSGVIETPETPPSSSCAVPFYRDPNFVNRGTLLN